MQVTASAIQEVLSRVDHDEGLEIFAEELEAKRDSLKAEGGFKNRRHARQISKILRNERLLVAAYNHACQMAAAAWIVQANEDETPVIDFFKWLVEWFSDGGWEIILNFIRGLLPLFGLVPGVSVALLLMVVVALL